MQNENSDEQSNKFNWDIDHFQQTEETAELPLILRRNENSVRISLIKDVTERVVNKRGRTNVFLHKIPNKELRFIRDLGNTLIHIRWRWILLTVALVNTFAYLAFSGLWMLIAWMDGDIGNPEPGHKICIQGAEGFTGYLLLSIETITTTGYGYIYPTDDCRLAWLILTLSTVVVVVIDGAFFTVVYVKITRPINRDVVRFSKKAVISLRNGRVCLVFRISDRRGKHWIKTKINGYVIIEKTSHEGDVFSNYLTPLKLENFGVLLWPIDVVHRIDENSPLWNVSANDLMTKKFEVLVVVRGDSISSGQPSQSQISYVSKEVLWGHRFEPCVSIEQGKPQFVVDYEKFNKTVPFDTPLCSARQLEGLQEQMITGDSE